MWESWLKKSSRTSRAYEDVVEKDSTNGMRIFIKCSLFHNQRRENMSNTALYKYKVFILARKLNSDFPDPV